MRPLFEDIKSFKEFEQYYWYRRELQEICRDLGVSSHGTKNELMYNIEQYYKGNLIKRKRRKVMKNKINELTLDTKILENGFSLRNEYRSFFSKITGIPNFKYSARMATALRKARDENNVNLTVRDLLDVHFKKKFFEPYENKSCEWNQFVKDFCKDERNKIYQEKLKVAAILWKDLKNSKKEKKYSYRLIEENKSLLEPYLKKTKG